MNINHIRTRWAAIGAAVAVTLGAGGIGITHATTTSGERPIYLPIEPCRLADTRPEFRVGPRSAPLGPGETYNLSGWGNVGNCTLPDNTAGLALNVTPVDPAAPTFLTFFPAGVPLPTASNLNPTPGQPPTPNAVNVDLNDGGVFSVYNLAGNVHVAIDVVGIYDDHNHDDRYYTEEEVEPRLPDAAIGFNADGSIRAGVDNVSSISYDAGLGRYEIDFDDFGFSINSDVASVVARTPGVNATYSSVGGSTLLVYLTNPSGTAVQAPFTVIVWDSVE